MTDTKLRDLERRWRESGRVEDEAAYLLERVRVGDLTQERLELAAYCGHKAARVALGSGAWPDWSKEPRQILEHLLLGGSTLGAVLLVRLFAVLATRQVCSLAHVSDQARVALAEGVRLTLGPSPESGERALRAARAARGVGHGTPPCSWRFPESAAHILCGRPSRWDQGADPNEQLVRRLLDQLGATPDGEAGEDRKLLAAWLLGSGDPLAACLGRLAPL